MLSLCSPRPEPSLLLGRTLLGRYFWELGEDLTRFLDHSGSVIVPSTVTPKDPGGVLRMKSARCSVNAMCIG